LEKRLCGRPLTLSTPPSNSSACNDESSGRCVLIHSPGKDARYVLKMTRTYLKIADCCRSDNNVE
jgi:hypothetical protein